MEIPLTRSKSTSANLCTKNYPNLSNDILEYKSKKKYISLLNISSVTTYLDSFYYWIENT